MGRRSPWSVRKQESEPKWPPSLPVPIDIIGFASFLLIVNVTLEISVLRDSVSLLIMSRLDTLDLYYFQDGRPFVRFTREHH